MNILTEINDKLDKLRLEWKEGKRDRFALTLEGKMLHLIKDKILKREGL